MIRVALYECGISVFFSFLSLVAVFCFLWVFGFGFFFSMCGKRRKT